MHLLQLTKPAIEPISLEEFKLHTKIDNDDEDTLISHLITASREYIEKISNVVMIDRSYKLTLHRWPYDNIFRIPIFPIRSISSISIPDSKGTSQTLPHTLYDIDIMPDKITIKRNNITAWPLYNSQNKNISINFIAGFSSEANQIPQDLKQAILLLSAHWYEHREAVTTDNNGKIVPLALYDLITPYRKIRIA